MPRASAAWMRVYPRGCGGTRNGRLLAAVRQGLSPRVRGNRRSDVGAARRMGSIPAGAGEPTAANRIAAIAGVYPRGCGGTKIDPLSAASLAGLSPRVRGNHTGQTRLYARRGSIPAGAGEPRRSPDATRPPRVYPRGCGGTVVSSMCTVAVSGLSPRVRGNRKRGKGLPRQPGSIPAGAGEPRTCPRRSSCPRVYPRGCGGTARPNRRARRPAGLSPRVRGNLLPSLITAAGSRSIPAGAGEPGQIAFNLPEKEVYPRGCGGTSP